MYLKIIANVPKDAIIEPKNAGKEGYYFITWRPVTGDPAAEPKEFEHEIIPSYDKKTGRYCVYVMDGALEWIPVGVPGSYPHSNGATP